MPVLVDTSVWIEFFRGNQTPEVARLKALLGEEELLVGDLILAELLQGIRDERESDMVEEAFAAFEIVPLVGETMARESARNYRRLRRQGVTIRKTIDCLIATWCIENGVPLLHADRDFGPFAVLGLEEV